MTYRSFWAPGPPKLTFVESKRCQFQFILSMGQDGVLSCKRTFFLGHPVEVVVPLAKALK